MVQRKVQRRGCAHRFAADDRTLNAERIHHRAEIRGHVVDGVAGGIVYRRRFAMAALVVDYDPVLGRQRSKLALGPAPASGEAVGKDQGRPGAK